MPRLDEFAGRITVLPGATDDRAVIEQAVAGCDGVLAQAVLDFAPPRARLVFSCGWHITQDDSLVHESPAIVGRLTPPT